MSTVLVVYATYETSLRSTVRDHLYSFRRYAPDRCFYVNATLPWASALIASINPDVVVFHTSLLSQRWDRKASARLLRRLSRLRKAPAFKVMLPQDEFLDSQWLCRFIRQFNIDHVFSVAAPSEWPKIYRDLGGATPTMSQVLTGYLDVDTVERIDRLAPTVPRTIDVGYRAWHAEFWLGRQGQLKTELATRFVNRGEAFGLTTDVSTRAEDTLLGDDWFRFLLACRYTIGVEGGASILDEDGSLKDRTRAFVQQRPDATFAEVEASLFPDRDGLLDLRAISPRHLEACATGTCQILIEGDYNGILEANVHYMPLARDFSNLEQVLSGMDSEEARQAMVARARRDVVDNGRYTYRTFVETVINLADGRVDPSLARAAPGHAFRAIWDLSEQLSGPWLRTRYAISRRIIRPLRRQRARARWIRSLTRAGVG